MVGEMGSKGDDPPRDLRAVDAELRSRRHVRRLPESFVVKYEQLGRDDDRVLARVLATRRPTFDEEAFGRDGWRRSALYRHLGPTYKVKRYLCAPIVLADRVVGTLNIGRA